MKRRNARAMMCLLSVMSLTMMTGAAALADGEQPDRITIPYLQDNAWDELAMMNDDTVQTGVNIRAAADENSDVIGYLYHGGAVWVIDKGEEWTEVYSGGLTGFIKNDYLVYGSDAIGLADYYGTEGVATTWNDVNLYDEAGDTTAVKEQLNTGSYFPLVEDDGHWLTVQYGADDTAAVSDDDVSRVLILDTAVSKDEDSYSSDVSYEETYAEPTYEETYEEPTYEETYTEPTYEETYTEETYTEPTYEETYTEPAYEETYTETEASSDDNGYYDADTDTYYYDGSESYSETEAYVETEAPQTEAPQTEAQTEAASSSASSDDTALLAAIIYCEAGNQSREGMVAVGAVVMNRVNSSSFPNTISEVIYQSGQFTPAYSGSLSSALANGVPSACYEAAVAALNGENPVGNALYFNTGSGKGIKIGAHQFY